jgi:hypothetical protein
VHATIARTRSKEDVRERGLMRSFLLIRLDEVIPVDNGIGRIGIVPFGDSESRIDEVAVEIRRTGCARRTRLKAADLNAVALHPILLTHDRSGLFTRILEVNTTEVMNSQCTSGRFKSNSRPNDLSSFASPGGNNCRQIPAGYAFKNEKPRANLRAGGFVTTSNCSEDEQTANPTSQVHGTSVSALPPILASI